jgi:hypothetical protein
MHFHDLFANNFVFMRPLDLTIYLIWMGRAESDVKKSRE